MGDASNSGGKKDPAFLFFAADWLTSESVAGMRLDEQGAYTRLLCYSWLHFGIPDNMRWLSATLGVSGGDLERIWQVLSPCWTEMPGTPGRLFNKRQEHERAERKRKAEDMRRRGQAGGKQSASGRASRDEAGGQAGDEAEPKPSTSTGKEGRKELGTSDLSESVPDGTAVPGGRVGEVLAAAPATMRGTRAGGAA